LKEEIETRYKEIVMLLNKKLIEMEIKYESTIIELKRLNDELEA